MYVCCTHRAGTTGTMLLMHLQGRDSGSALQEARLILDDHDHNDDDDHDLDEDVVDFNTKMGRSFFHAL